MTWATGISFIAVLGYLTHKGDPAVDHLHGTDSSEADRQALMEYLETR